eukprot:TRINITY_DN62859_c0_g1_i2.p1 TRINITY_DN62859_c0_g1~~TRINITY_DN62859_c0_g1_i2.p1  ORF type:complete len:754 (-),score=190.32 TRINITY_DN62859_c0_g1_i2:38-2206(-)
MGAKPAGFIDIAGGKYFRAATIAVKVDGKQLEHAIEIRMEKRKYVLLCNDIDTRNKWLRGLTKWQKLKREGVLETKLPSSQGINDYDDTEQSVSKSKSKDDEDDEESKFVNPVNHNQKLKELSEDMTTLLQTLDRIHNKLRDADDVLIEKVYGDIEKMVSKAFDGRFDNDVDQSVYTDRNHSPSQSLAMEEDFLAKIQADWLPQQSEIKSNVFHFLKNNQKFKAFMLDLVEKGYTRAREICNFVPNAEFEATAKALINVFDLMNCTRPFLKTVLEEVVKLTATAGILLRETTVQTRMLSYYIQIEGTMYIRSMLFTFVTEIVSHEDLSFEVNTSKAGGDEQVIENSRLLRNFVERLLNRIISSISEAPDTLRVLAFYLREAAIQKFPESSYSSVGGLMFLRFICPALLVPEEWGLVSSPPSPKPSRNLVLVAKILQNIGNGIEFGTKEDYMMCMNDTVKRYIPDVQKFFQEFSSPPKDCFEVPFKSVDKGEVDASMSDLDWLMRVSARIQTSTISGTLSREFSKEKNKTISEQKTQEKPSLQVIQKSIEEATKVPKVEDNILKHSVDQQSITTGESSGLSPRGIPLPNPPRPQLHRRARSSIDVLPSQVGKQTASTAPAVEPIDEGDGKVNSKLAIWEGKIISPMVPSPRSPNPEQASKGYDSKARKVPVLPNFDLSSSSTGLPSISTLSSTSTSGKQPLGSTSSAVSNTATNQDRAKSRKV